MPDFLNNDMDPHVLLEHFRTRDFFADVFKGLDHPEASRALMKVVGCLRLIAGSLWDGATTLSPERQIQARTDATVIADLGTAIQEHLEKNRP